MPALQEPRPQVLAEDWAMPVWLQSLGFLMLTLAEVNARNLVTTGLAPIPKAAPSETPQSVDDAGSRNHFGAAMHRCKLFMAGHLGRGPMGPSLYSGEPQPQGATLRLTTL
jgi:hypothetical protein